MKVLFVNHTASRTGAPISCLKIMAGLGPGCEPVFLTREEGPLLMMLRDQGIRFHVLTDKGLLGIRLIRAVMAIIRQEGIALIHLNTLTPFCKYAGIAGFLKRVPVLWMVREDPLISRSRRLRFWMKLVARKIVFVDNDTRGKLLPGHPDAVTVHNGADLDRFRPGQTDFLRQRLGMEAGSRLIGYVGSITKRKGTDVLVRAMKKVREAFPDARLALIGSDGRDPDYAAGIKKLVAELGLGGTVFFCGEISEVEKALGSLDLVVLPSFDERCSRSLIEATAAGKAVVATRVGGTPEIVADGENGLLVEPHNVDQLAAAIMRLLGDEKARKDMERKARRIAEERFDVKKTVREMEGLYRELGLRCEG